MMHSPLMTEPLFRIGEVPVSTPVATTWVLMALIGVAAVAMRRRLSLTPGKLQTAAELFVSTLDSQLRDTMQVEPARCRALLGTLFLFILTCNWSGVVPGVEPLPPIWKPTPPLPASSSCRRCFTASASAGSPGISPRSHNRPGS